VSGGVVRGDLVDLFIDMLYYVLFDSVYGLVHV
jgi:hypothetical protein